MNFYRHTILGYIVLGIYLVSPIVVAEETGSDTFSITITPTRVEKNVQDIPAAVSVVGQDQIQSGTEQLGVDESLKQIPGLFFLNRYNFAQDVRASIRGFGSRADFGIRGIKIIVDGIPETLADGQGSVDGIDIGSAKTISVIRGTASSLYGNASGGAILIETEQMTGLPFAEFKLIAGDYGYRKPQLKLGGGGRGNLSYLLNLSDTSLDGYRNHSEFENTQFNGRFDYRLSDHSSLMTTIHHTDQPVANDPGGINAAAAAADPKQARDRNVTYDVGESLEQTRIGVLFKNELNANEALEARIYHTDRDFSNKLPQFPVADGVDLQRNFFGGGVKYTRSNHVGERPNRLLVGLDYEHQDDDRKRFQNDQGVLGTLLFAQNERVTSLGAYLQNETLLTEKLEMTIGVRYDDIEFDFSDEFLTDGDDSGKVSLDHVSPMVGLSFRKNSNTRYYVNISNSFETPTTTEFANPSGGGINQNLDPQESTSYEVGVKRQGENSSFELALFHIDIDDELISFEPPVGRDFYDNAGSSSRDGLELAYSRYLTEQIKLAFSYTWSDFVFERFTDTNGNVFDGNRTPGIPEHLLHIDLSWHSGNGMYATLKNTYTGSLFADNANATEVESHRVSDLRVGYNHFQKDWEIEGFVGVNNLLDEEYNNNIRINAFGGRYFEPAPERNALVGITVRKKFAR